MIPSRPGAAPHPVNATSAPLCPAHARLLTAGRVLAGCPACTAWSAARHSTTRAA